MFIVEDDDGDQMMTSRALKGLAKSTEIAKDGAAAIERIEELCAAGRAPDVILLDLKLPLLNGFEVLQRLMQNGVASKIPVVVFSSSDVDSDRERCMQLGAKSFISKPVDYNEYIDSLRRAVHSALLRLE